MTAPLGRTNCRRPLVRVLGDAARCSFCGAERGESCRMLRYDHLGPITVRTLYPDGSVVEDVYGLEDQAL